MHDNAALRPGDIDRTQDNWSEESDAVGRDIHQEPRNRDKHRTTSVGGREKNPYSGFSWRRHRNCGTSIPGMAGNLQHYFTLLRHDTDERLRRLGKSILG